MRRWGFRVVREIANNMDSNDFKIIPPELTEKNKNNLQFIVPDGMYKGQTHVVEISWMRYDYAGNMLAYPIYPPTITFKTPIYHPNINDNGVICVDVFNENWSPCYGINTIYNSLLLLLENPDVSSPLNEDASVNYANLELSDFIDLAGEYYNQNIKSLDEYNVC